MARSRWFHLLSLVLVAGTGVWLVKATKFQNPTPATGMGIGAAAAVVAYQLAPVRRGVLRGYRWMQELSGPQRSRFAFGLVLAGCLVLLAVHYLAGRPFEMMWHDEFQFHLQSQLVARGTLWMPPHPLGEFFDTFYVLMTPYYAPQSFPGAAMMYAPTVWLGLPTWSMPLIVAAIGAALLWRVLAEACGPALALVGWVVLLSLPGYERLSTMYLAQIPVLVLCLGGVLAAMRFRKTRGIGAAATMGALMGWAAITRPLDAACWGGLIVLLLLPMLRNTTLARLGTGTVATLAAAIPFLGIQLVFNQAVTGSILKTPFQFYNERDQPALAFGSADASQTAPASDIPQKQEFYQSFTLRWVKLHQHPSMTWRLKWQNNLNILQPALGGTVWLIPVALVGLLAMGHSRRFWIVAILPLFVVGYTFYPIFLPHYMTFALPAWVLLIASAPIALARAFPAKRHNVITCVGGLIVMGMCIGASAHWIHRESPDHVLKLLRDANGKLATVKPPAIVLFTAPPGGNALHLEHVYNDDVAWPDDAPVIRAHDRGNENIRLFAYYADRQPERMVWRFDRTNGELRSLGNVRELASSAASP